MSARDVDGDIELAILAGANIPADWPVSAVVFRASLAAAGFAVVPMEEWTLWQEDRARQVLGDPRRRVEVPISAACEMAAHGCAFARAATPPEDAS